MEPNGSVALITGASRGIGRGIAVVLAGLGMKLALNYHSNEEAASAVLREVRSLGADAITTAADVSDEAQVEAMVESVRHHFGRVDVLVNNAGIDSAHTLESLSLDEWQHVISVNLTGAFLCSRAVIPHMRRKRRGRIVMISSIAGLRGTGNVHYVASKAGLLGLTLALARLTAGAGITVNAVAPGLTRSEMLFESLPDIEHRLIDEVPLGRLCEPQEVGQVVAFLVRNDYITGETINVSGGRHIAI